MLAIDVEAGMKSGGAAVRSSAGGMHAGAPGHR